MRKLPRALYDLAVSKYCCRRFLAWVATKTRQRKRLYQVVQRLNPNVDPWANACREPTPGLQQYTIDLRSLLQRPVPSAIGLLALKTDSIVEPFLASCSLLGTRCEIFDPAHSAFLDQIEQSSCEFYVSRPNHARALERGLFLEKEMALRNYLGKMIFPNLVEHQIYEAKRVLTYFLQSNAVPHPRTFITYSREEAAGFVEGCELPQVFKTTNGAGSSGVEIIRTRSQARQLVKVLFDAHYVNRTLNDYRDIDYGYLLLQEFLPNVREFRIMKVGDSWFGHEKAKLAEQAFMSGSGVNLWTPPPLDLLDFCDAIAARFGFNTMCFDVFLTETGHYLINELQAWFGSYNPSQMYIDGVPGRYVKDAARWVFQPGCFNQLQSIPLRLISYINSCRVK